MMTVFAFEQIKWTATGTVINVRILCILFSFYSSYSFRIVSHCSVDFNSVCILSGFALFRSVWRFVWDVVCVHNPFHIQSLFVVCNMSLSQQNRQLWRSLWTAELPNAKNLIKIHIILVSHLQKKKVDSLYVATIYEHRGIKIVIHFIVYLCNVLRWECIT